MNLACSCARDSSLQLWIPEKIAGPTSEKIAGPEVSRNEFFSKMKESSNNDLAVCSVRWRDS